jgi:hypothetical protein
VLDDEEAIVHVTPDVLDLLVPFAERTHFPYQCVRLHGVSLMLVNTRFGRWFEGAWLYELDGARAELTRLPTFRAETIQVRAVVGDKRAQCVRVQMCFKNTWVMFVGDNNAMNMFRALAVSRAHA